MVTLEQFNNFPSGEIIQTGLVENSPVGIYISSFRVGDFLRYVAVKGWGSDWALYVGWIEDSPDIIAQQGDKVSMLAVTQLFSADEEVYALYRR